VAYKTHKDFRKILAVLSL